MNESPIDIHSMLDSLEEAIASDGWSDIPPPPASGPLPPLGALRAPFAGISAELHRHPDPPSPPSPLGSRPRGTAAVVLAKFKWGVE